MNAQQQRQQRHDEYTQEAARAAASAQGHAPLPGHMNRADAWSDFRRYLQLAQQCESTESPDGLHVWSMDDRCVHCGVTR